MNIINSSQTFEKCKNLIKQNKKKKIETLNNGTMIELKCPTLFGCFPLLGSFSDIEVTLLPLSLQHSRSKQRVTVWFWAF